MMTIIGDRNRPVYFYLKKKMAPVLVIVDLSNSSLNAAKYAADMAVALRAKLIMIHVVQLAEVCLSLSSDEAELYKVQKRRITWLNELKMHLLARTDNKIEIEGIILHGEFESELEKFCALQHPLLLVTGLNTNTSDAHHQNSINVSGLSENIKCDLLIVPSHSFYQGFRWVTIITNRQQSNAGDIVSLIRKWLRQFDNSQEPELHVRRFIEFAVTDLASKEKIDLVVNATHDVASLDMLLHSIQPSSHTENYAPAVLSLAKEDLSTEIFSHNITGAKGHDCSVCNGACRTKKNIINKEEILSK